MRITRIPLFGQENKRTKEGKSFVDRKSMACMDRWPGEKKELQLLVYDSFEAHVTDTVKASFKRENTELAVIPGS